MVVNSARRSGLFFSAGWSVFFSQACSLAEGARSTEDVSAGGAASVVPLDAFAHTHCPREEFNYLFERPQRLMLFERYLRARVVWPRRRQENISSRPNEEKVWKRKSRPGLAPEPAPPRDCRCHLAEYSLAVNSLWPTDCGCPTVPFGAFPSSATRGEK